jgi:hypothetical protein
VCVWAMDVDATRYNWDCVESSEMAIIFLLYAEKAFPIRMFTDWLV